MLFMEFLKDCIKTSIKCWIGNAIIGSIVTTIIVIVGIVIYFMLG